MRSEVTNQPVDVTDYETQDLNIKSQEKLDKMRNQFSHQIQIDFIDNMPDRVKCRHINVVSVDKIGQHSITDKLLISLLKMQCIEEYAKHKGYKIIGKLNFDRNGNVIHCEKTKWEIKNKKYIFITNGFLYLQSEDENIIIECRTTPENGTGDIICYAATNKKAEFILKDIEKYVKENNVFRKSKLRNINIFQASFDEVNYSKEHTLDNYYYSDTIKKLFYKEIIGLLENNEEYLKMGITKRGFILHGRPGTGKTTLGYIICNLLSNYSVVWITPEMIAENGIGSIKLLYKIAEYITPCVIILEDLDLYAQDRSNMVGGVSIGSLMNILDGVNTVKNCITIGTTNKISVLETALKNRPGRFDRIVEITGLNKELRRKMLKKHFNSYKKEDKVIEHMVKKTDDWTGAELQELINTININMLQQKNKKITIDKVNKAFETMSQFGIGLPSEHFGFAK